MGPHPDDELRAMCSENAAALFRHPLPRLVLPMKGTDVFEPTPEKLLPDLSPARSSCSWPGPSGGRATTITSPVTSPATSVTGRCCATRGSCSGTSSGPRQVIRIDLAGNVVEGDWPAARHPAPPRAAQGPARPTWAVHNHPLYGTVLADMGIVAPPMDQSSALGGGELVLVDEYDGGVDSMDAAAGGRQDGRCRPLALLAGHGVFVLGSTARAVTSERSRSSNAASGRGTS